MPIAKGAQLEFWRHLLSLNGIDWESEQVSFSDDDECYTCMPRMAWLSDSCTTPSQARHWLASEFSNLHQTYPDNIEHHEEFKSGGAWGVLMLVMSMKYMEKQSTWKKRQSMASLDGIFKRSSGSSTRNNNGPTTPSPRRTAHIEEEPTLISTPGFRQRPNRRSITLSTPLITASNIHTASQRQLNPISPSPSTPTDTTDTLKSWTAGSAKNGYDAKLNPDLADFIAKPLSEPPNDFFDFDPPISSPEPSPPSPISPSSSQYAYPAFPHNVRTVTFFPNNNNNNDNMRTVSGCHTHLCGHIRSRSAPTIPAIFNSNTIIANDNTSISVAPGSFLDDSPLTTPEVTDPPPATVAPTTDLSPATKRRMRRDQPMYGGEFVRYLGAIERPDTPPTPPLDHDDEVDVEMMDPEGGGTSSTSESPEIPSQEQTQDSRSEERQSAGLVSRLPVVIQRLWKRLCCLRDTVCIRGGGAHLNARRRSRVNGPQMSETEKVHVR